MCKPLGHVHRRGFADVGSLVQTSDDQAVADTLDELKGDAAVGGEVSDWALREVERRTGKYGDHANQEMQGQRGGADGLCRYGGEGEEPGDSGDLHDGNIGDRIESDADGTDLLHHLHGLPYDLRFAARSRELGKDAVEDDGGDCGVLDPALTLLRSLLRPHHSRRAREDSSFTSQETAKFNVDVMIHLCAQAQLEYIFATLPIYDAQGNRIRDPGSVSAGETIGEKIARVARDVRSGVLVIDDGGAKVEVPDGVPCA